MAMAMAMALSSSFSSPVQTSSATTNAGACLKTFEGLRGVANTKMVNSSLSYFQKVNPACGVRATAVESPPAAVPKQKIRVKLRSYWVPLIEQASDQILEAARNTNSKVMGPVRLPTKRRIYCVLRSPHVDKDSREHFEKRTHQRIIDLVTPNAETIDALMQLDLPEGVDVEVKL